MTTQVMPVEVQMALGRIFALMSRPFQEGDVEQYEKARGVVLDCGWDRYEQVRIQDRREFMARGDITA
jgi:hypothetical protein